MPLPEIVFTELSKRFVSRILDYLAAREPHLAEDDEKIRKHVGLHQTEILNWTNSIQFFGMTQPEGVDSTVEVKLDSIPRMFRDENSEHELLSEDSILGQPDHYVVLGDPGSGKTTMIMRLVQRFFEPATVPDDPWQYPIVIRLRSISGERTIFEAIADILGIEHYTK